MPIEYLQIVSIPVSDQDRAKEFYVNALGWNLLSDEGYEIGGAALRWLEVRPPGGQTAITLVTADDTTRAGTMTGMILRTTDLNATVAELAGRGVELDHEVRETPSAKYTSFKDPDGNTWMVQEVLRR